MSLKINGFEVELVDATPPGQEQAGPYSGFKPATTTLPKGHRRQEGFAPFQADTILDKDFAVPLRDGVTIRADIFRPATDEKVPEIVIWSPYGKDGNGSYYRHWITRFFLIGTNRCT